MIKKFICVFVAAVMLTTCFAGCDNDESETYFACAINEMPRYFDPQSAGNAGERMVAFNIFDGLFKQGPDNELQNCAAVDYKISADGLTYTFYLRQDMKYYISDEVKDFLEKKEASIEGLVTADDFVFALRRAVLPETEAVSFPLLSKIVNAEEIHDGKSAVDTLGVRAIDRYTLEIKLKQKQNNFLYVLTQPVTFPCDEEFFNLTDGRYGLDEEYIISNGSFYLSDIKDEESVRFSKNPEYSGDFKANPTSVRLYVNTNEVNIAQKVNDGTYDFGFFTSDKAIDELGRKVSKAELENITTALVFNTEKDTFKNVKLRTGLLSAIDKQSVTENSAVNLVPSHYRFAGGAVEGISYNINTARENMIAAFKELEKENLTVNILCTPEYEDTAKKIVNCWQANIGVELNGTITVANEDDFDKKITSGEFDTAIYSLTVDSAESVDFLSVFTSENEGNICSFASDEFDRLVTQLRVNPTKENTASCESYLLKNAVILPLYYDVTIVATAKDSSGVYFAGDSSGVFFYKGQKS